MPIIELGHGAEQIYWLATALCAVGALEMTWKANTPNGELGLFIVFDIANPNPKAFGLGLLAAAVKAAMSVIHARELPKRIGSTKTSSTIIAPAEPSQKTPLDKPNDVSEEHPDRRHQSMLNGLNNFKSE